jgi:hypothetical protein
MRLLAIALASLLVLSACGEREQVMEGKRTYQGKRDTKAWDNAPLAYGSAKWNKGDEASWEAQIKSRQAVQNEYNRIGR